MVLTDPQASFVAEAAEIPVTVGTLTEIDVVPKKLAALSVISSELAQDSSPAALQVVGDGIVRDVKRQLDASFFGNTTANGPSGLGSLTTAVATNAGSWANLDSFEAANANAEVLHSKVTASSRRQQQCWL